MSLAVTLTIGLAALHARPASLTAAASAQPAPDVEARDAAGRTPLIQAAMADRPQEVRRLIAAGADVQAVDGRGYTALLHAAQSSLESVRLLIAAGADVEHRDDLGTSALSVAKEAGRSDIVGLLREHGATESLEEQLDEAIRAGDRQRLTRLIEAGADVDALDSAAYQTPLMTAIEHRDIESVLILLEAGADPAKEGTGIETTHESALSLAARQPSPWVLRQLVERGSRTSRASLEAALFAGCEHPDALRVLIENGASPNTRGPEGRTPLHCAAAAGAEQAATYLLEAGADPRIRTGSGESAAALAEAAGASELARRLRAAAR